MEMCPREGNAKCRFILRQSTVIKSYEAAKYAC